MSEQETEFDQDQGTEDVVVDALIETQDRYSSTKDVDARNAIWEGLSDEEREGMAELGYAGPIDLDVDEVLEDFIPIRPGSPGFAQADKEARLNVASAIRRMNRGEVEVAPELRDEIETLHAEASVLPAEQGSALVQRAARLVSLLDEGAGRAPEEVRFVEEVVNSDGSVVRTGRSNSGNIVFEERVSAEEIEALERDEQQVAEHAERPWGDQPDEVTPGDAAEFTSQQWDLFEREHPLRAGFILDLNAQETGMSFEAWKRLRAQRPGWR